MLEVIMQYTNKESEEIWVLSGEYDELYIINLNKLNVTDFGAMGSLYDVFEDIDLDESIYVKDMEYMKEWLFDNQDALNIISILK